MSVRSPGRGRETADGHGQRPCKACYQHVHLITSLGWARQRGVEAVMTPPLKPLRDACAEQCLLTTRTEVADRILISSERRLRPTIAEYDLHYNG
jgi:hypothetical protein